MHATERLFPVLERLRLVGAIESLERRAQEATEARLEPTEFLFRLLRDEEEHRRNESDRRTVAPWLAAPARARPRLVVGPEARWFKVGDGDAVDLSRRGANRRIFSALTSRHLAGSVQALDTPALVAIGWPGEILPASAGATRVYTAIRTLRRMGLEGLLITHDDGYLLDPKIELAQA